MTVSRRGFLRLGGVSGAAVLAQRLLHPRRDDDHDAQPSEPDADGAQAGTTVSPWAGDADQTSVQIAAFTTGTRRVGLAISTKADLSDATYVDARPPNDYGWNKWQVDNLRPATQYYYRVTDTLRGGQRRLIGDLSRFKTLQPVGTACTTRIAVGSCGRYPPVNPAALQDIVGWQPDRTMHLGDFGYPQNLTTDIGTHYSNWAVNSTDPGMHAIHTMACMDYIVSDHDGNDNGKRENRPNYHDPITKVNLEAWRRVVPARMADSRPMPRGRWRSEVEGNVRFVKLDTRSLDRTDVTKVPTDPHATSSTMLGPVQLAWLQSQIDAAAEDRQLVVLFTDCAWNGTSPGPPIPGSYSDKWPSYIYERDLISDYAAAAGVDLFIVFGDSHGLQQDDGTHEKNGFASICCGPLDMELHMHFQDSYQWNYPDDIPEHGGPYRFAQQYQRLTIEQQEGSSIVTVTAAARDCSPVVDGTPTTVRTLTKSYSL